MQPILILTGMHRSGTSLTASLLQSAGVNIGSKLIEAGRGNSQGHFEDIDFVQFHERVLESQNIRREGWTLADHFTVTKDYAQEAKALVESKKSSEQIIGWKDPRTTLFLEFWQRLIPEAKFILIYRAPWEVVDSLYRRGDDVFQQQPELAIEIWFNYNIKILRFVERHRRQSLLFNINEIIRNNQILIETIQQQWQLNLSQPENLYQANLFRQEEKDSYRAKLIKYYYPGAYNLYQQLNQLQSYRTKQSGVKLDSSSRQYIFYDWQALAQAQAEIKQLRKQIQLQPNKEQLQQHKTETQTQLEQYQNQLEQIEHQLDLSKAKEDELSQQLQSIQNEKEQIQQQCLAQQAEIEKFQHQLEAKQHEIKQLETLIADMENSKFWQLRNKYHQLKQQLKINKSK